MFSSLANHAVSKRPAKSDKPIGEVEILGRPNMSIVPWQMVRHIWMKIRFYGARHGHEVGVGHLFAEIGALVHHFGWIGRQGQQMAERLQLIIGQFREVVAVLRGDWPFKVAGDGQTTIVFHAEIILRQKNRHGSAPLAEFE
jgi:hypothetical protein